MDTIDFKLTIYARKYWNIIILFSIVLVAIKGAIPDIVNFKNIISKIENLHILFYCIFYTFLFSIFREIVWLTAKATIIVNSEKLRITKYFFGIPFTTTYPISKISNFIIKHNVPGKRYFKGRPGQLFTSSKPLIIEPTMLYFDFEKKTKNIGAHLKDFPAESIVEAIKSRQKNVLINNPHLL